MLDEIGGFLKNQLGGLKEGTHLLSANASVSRQSLYYGVRNAKIAGDLKVAEDLSDNALKSMGVSKTAMKEASNSVLIAPSSGGNVKQDYKDYLSASYKDRSSTMLNNGMDRSHKGTLNSLINIGKDEGAKGLLSTAKRYYTEEGLKTGLIRGGVSAAAIAIPVATFGSVYERNKKVGWR